MLQVTHFKLQYYKLTIPEHGELVWNITRAKECVARGELHQPTPMAITRPVMEKVIAQCEWDEDHLVHVDPAIPGISAPMIWEGHVIWIPIDGIHRIVRAVRENRPFSVWMLTEAASRACLLSGPLGLVP